MQQVDLLKSNPKGTLPYAGGVVISAFADWPRAAVALLASVLLNLWSDTPKGLQTLLAAAGTMFVLDLLSGMLRALKQRDFDSNRLGGSLIKFAIYAMSVCAACAIDRGLQLGSIALGAVVLLVFLREAMSFVENSTALGFPWPRWIVEKLATMRQETEDGSEPSRTRGDEQT